MEVLRDQYAMWGYITPCGVTSDLSLLRGVLSLGLIRTRTTGHIDKPGIAGSTAVKSEVRNVEHRTSGQIAQFLRIVIRLTLGNNTQLDGLGVLSCTSLNYFLDL